MAWGGIIDVCKILGRYLGASLVARGLTVLWRDGGETQMKRISRGFWIKVGDVGK